MVKLISEAVENVEFITEEKKGGKSYKIRGIFMQADVKNRNGRVYPLDILTKEVTKYNKNFIQQNRAFGELGHPDGPTVNLERVSHMITSLTPDGKNFIGEAKIMETPMGKIVKNLMDEGAKLGVSSRGMGSLNQKNGASYVRDDFYLATAADIVADPSAPNAFVEGIMEGKEWVWNNGSLVEAHVADLKKKFGVKKRRNEANIRALEFAKFLKML
ncbi:MAG: primosomal protein [SAR324 cluster bacterium]|nr:primosomal protein [SAR324 cluster bacterium]